MIIQEATSYAFFIPTVYYLDTGYWQFRIGLSKQNALLDTALDDQLAIPCIFDTCGMISFSSF